MAVRKAKKKSVSKKPARAWNLLKNPPKKKRRAKKKKPVKRMAVRSKFPKAFARLRPAGRRQKALRRKPVKKKRLVRKRLVRRKPVKKKRLVRKRLVRRKPVKGKKLVKRRKPVRKRPVKRKRLVKRRAVRKKVVRRKRRVVTRRPVVVSKEVFPEEKVARIVESVMERVQGGKLERVEETVLTKAVSSAMPCDEELALKMIDVYFGEVARYGLKRKLALDEVVNAYFYCLMRVQRKDVEMDAVKEMIGRRKG